MRGVVSPVPIDLQRFDSLPLLSERARMGARMRVRGSTCIVVWAWVTAFIVVVVVVVVQSLQKKLKNCKVLPKSAPPPNVKIWVSHVDQWRHTIP